MEQTPLELARKLVQTLEALEAEHEAPTRQSELRADAVSLALAVAYTLDYQVAKFLDGTLLDETDETGETR